MDNSDTKTHILVIEFFLSLPFYIFLLSFDISSLFIAPFLPLVRRVGAAKSAQVWYNLGRHVRCQFESQPAYENKDLNKYLDEHLWPLLKDFKLWEKRRLHVELEALIPCGPLPDMSEPEAARYNTQFVRHLKRTLDPKNPANQLQLVSISDSSLLTMATLARFDINYRKTFELKPDHTGNFHLWEEAFDILIGCRDRAETPLHIKSYINLFLAEVLAGAGYCIFPWILVNVAIAQLVQTTSHHGPVYMPPRIRGCVISQYEKADSLRTMLMDRRSRQREPVVYFFKYIRNHVFGMNQVQADLAWLRSQGRRHTRELPENLLRAGDDGCIEITEEGMGIYVPGRDSESESADEFEASDTSEEICMEEQEGDREEEQEVGSEGHISLYEDAPPVDSGLKGPATGDDPNCREGFAVQYTERPEELYVGEETYDRSTQIQASSRNLSREPDDSVEVDEIEGSKMVDRIVKLFETGGSSRAIAVSMIERLRGKYLIESMEMNSEDYGEALLLQKQLGQIFLGIQPIVHNERNRKGLDPGNNYTKFQSNTRAGISGGWCGRDDSGAASLHTTKGKGVVPERVGDEDDGYSHDSTIVSLQEIFVTEGGLCQEGRED